MSNWVTLGSGIHICESVKEKRFGVFAGRDCDLGIVVEGEHFTPRIYIAVIGHGPTSGRKIELWYNGSLWASHSDFNNRWHEIYANFWRSDNEPLMAGEWEARYYEGTTNVLSKSLTITPPPANVECIEIGVQNTSIVAGQNPGVQSTWRNNGTKSVSIDVPLIIDGIVVNAPIYLQSESERQIYHTTTDAMKTAGTHTIEIPPEFNKSGVLPITYEVKKIVDPCEGVTCDDVCIGADRYSQKCVNGVCMTDALLIANCPDCPGYVPPDPCKGVTCENVCSGFDLYSQKCVYGTCTPDQLIEANSSECGYVPPEPEPVCTPLLYGDVNGDGVVDQADATLLLNWVSFPNQRNTTYKLLCPENADVTGDGTVKLGDAVLLQNHVNFPNDPAYALGPKEPAPEPTPRPTPRPVCTPLLYGDVNGDGVVDQADATLLLNWVSFPNQRNTTYKLLCPENADVTGDGTVNIGDAVLLRNHVNFPNDPAYALGPKEPAPGPTPGPTPEPEYLCAVGAKRTLHTCADGSQIYVEICEGDELGGSAWAPSGESCPMLPVSRYMALAIPKIMYEGQPVDIVVESYYGATPSSGEPTDLIIDGVTVDTMNTSAGAVTFRWIATGVGMRRICVSTPANPVHESPGSVCKIVMVSAHVPGLAARVKEEMREYEAELNRLREIRKVKREILRGVTSAGEIWVPPSFAGLIVEIGGVPRTVPPDGVTIPASPGETLVTIIEDGVRKVVTVIVSPGGSSILPTPSIPWS